MPAIATRGRLPAAATSIALTRRRFSAGNTSSPQPRASATNFSARSHANNVIFDCSAPANSASSSPVAAQAAANERANSCKPRNAFNRSSTHAARVTSLLAAAHNTSTSRPASSSRVKHCPTATPAFVSRPEAGHAATRKTAVHIPRTPAVYSTRPKAQADRGRGISVETLLTPPILAALPMKLLCCILASGVALVSSLHANGGEHFPFHIGEKLSYQVYWGPFIAGHATLEVAGIQTVDGRDCYHLIATAATTGIADLLFPVEIKTESWLDTDELCTRRFRQDRREGKRRKTDESHYDYAAGTVTTTNFLTGKVRSAPLSEPVQDLISSLYYVRTQPLQLDLATRFPLNVSGTNYLVTARPDERKSLYTRPTGHILALRIEPEPTLHVVAANSGRLWFWLSDDERKLPLMVTSDMKIGNARLVLTKIQSGNPTLDKLTRRN